MTILQDLLRRVHVTGTNLDSLAVECGELRTNSLECRAGDTFLCLRGGRLDGHDFICTAVDHGARLIICERVTDFLRAHPEIPYVTVENTRLACSHMWNERCGRPSERMIFVAVTGTNGKTSTTYFLREIFKTAGYVTGVIGTVRCMIGDEVRILTDLAESKVNAMTTPIPERLYTVLAEMADAGVEIVFMEASSHALTQYRLDPLRFTAGIFTGLAAEHLDYHGSMEEYYQAKRRLFELCGVGILNADDEYAERMAREIIIPSVTYSIAGTHADYAASDIAADSLGGIRYTMREKCGRTDVTCPVTGRFMAANTLAAVSCARLFGIAPDVIGRALASCPQIPGRMEHLPLPENCDFDVFIDYAHTP
ncbi:MAG: UDP-N-acetylmuramyl-tripeptide synthetase, partial [Ruminococcaceae bacterium]|nr:UDP-N-acetylmuramyl-tripeptide synthetase [Oscillospiraceae bacterium]